MAKNPQDVINKLLNEAVVRWTEITSLPSTKKYCRGDDYRSSYTLEKIRDELNESRELDFSGLTTGLLLHGYLNDYLDEMVFSGNDVIRHQQAVAEAVEPLIDLEKRLFSSPLAIYIDEFKDELRESANHYGYEHTEDLEKFLQRPLAVAVIRRDALASLKKLEAHQFVQSAQAAPAALQYNKQIFEFWNVNSLLNAARGQQLDGITLVLIREPKAVFSYFVFVVKNDSTITVLTDRQAVPHPGYQDMTRRPDRELYKRSCEHWFPYELLKFEMDEKQNIEFETRNQIVPINALGVPLSEISKLPPAQFVWTILIFNLLNEEYGTSHKLLPEISYTGEMVVAPDVLLQGSHALVSAAKYRPLEVAISFESASAEATKAQWEQPPVKHNAWMEARYESQVPASVFDQKALFLAPSLVHNLLGDGRGVEELSIRERFQLSSEDKVSVFRGDSFGTAGALQKDVSWTLRTNKMKVIQKLAEQEYEQEKANVTAWMEKRADERRNFLFDAMAKRELKLPWRDSHWRGQEHFKSGYDSGTSNAISFLKVGQYSGTFHEIRLGGFEACGDVDEDGYSCTTKPTLSATIDVNCPEAFALVYDVPEEELPWPLQHLVAKEPYHGNCILDRLDPQDWVLDNPWRQLSTTIRLYSCKRCFNARRKKLGLPRFDHSVNKEEDE